MAKRRPSTGLGNLRTKNWRQKREAHLLDVKVRPHVSRRIALSNTARWVLGLSALVILFTSLFFGVQAGADRLFLRNNRYTVHELRVETDGTLTRSQILDLAGVDRADNLFSINLSEVRGNLLSRARVAEAEVRRQLPDTLIIRVRERIPVAWVAPLADLAGAEVEAPVTAGGERVMRPAVDDVPEAGAEPALPRRSNALLTDADGLLLETDSLSASYVSLPLIRLAGPHRLQPGKQLEDGSLRDSLELLRCLSEELTMPFQVQTIDATRGYSLVVENRLGSQITFSRKEMRDQVRRLGRLLVYSETQGRQLASANLMGQKNFPVTFFPEGYQPPLGPTPAASDGVPVRRAMPAHSQIEIEAVSMP